MVLAALTGVGILRDIQSDPNLYRIPTCGTDIFDVAQIFIVIVKMTDYTAVEQSQHLLDEKDYDELIVYTIISIPILAWTSLSL